MELASTYSPQNVYCYAIDAKASKTFHARVNALAACLPNVFVTRVQYRMDSWGHNMSYSLMECLKFIKPMEWKYVMLLQVGHAFTTEIINNLEPRRCSKNKPGVD